MGASWSMGRSRLARRNANSSIGKPAFRDSMSMEAVGGEAEVFSDGPWMQDWTTFPLSFPNPGGSIDGSFVKTADLGFGEVFFICKGRPQNQIVYLGASE
jgi:hypothetical protein